MADYRYTDSLVTAVKRTLTILLGPMGEVITGIATIPAQALGAKLGLSIEVEGRPAHERVRRLDDARAALVESLEALDDLDREAKENQARYERALVGLAATMASKESAEQKLAAIQAAMKQDIGAFQTLAGVPNIQRERTFSFASGVVAGIIASLIVIGLQWLWKRYLG